MGHEFEIGFIAGITAALLVYAAFLMVRLHLLITQEEKEAAREWIPPEQC